MLSDTMRSNLRRFLPAEFQLWDQILTGLAVTLAGFVVYLFFTSEPRTGTGIWIQCQLFGSMLFVVISGKNRAFFTGLYCSLLSGGIFIFPLVVSVVRMPWPPGWADLHSEVTKIAIVALGFIFSVAIPVGVAWIVTSFIQFLERQFYK